MKHLFSNHKIALGIIIIVYAMLAASYSFLVPIYESPDEPGHISYILFLKNRHVFPKQLREEYQVPGEGHQPPLYYIIIAGVLEIAGLDIPRLDLPLNPAFKWGNIGTPKNMFVHGEEEVFPFSGTTRMLHIVRLYSTLMGGITVLLTYKICRTIFPDRRDYALAAAGLNAFIPQFTFISGVINNDSLVTLLSSLSILLLIRLLREKSGVKEGLFIGLAIGLDLITKITAGFLILVLAFVLIMKNVYLKHWRATDSLKVGGIVTGIIILIAGWFYLRNYILYGNFFGWGIMPSVDVMWLTDVPAHLYIILFFGMMVASFFGVFGWMNVFGNPVFLGILAELLLIGLLGLIFFFSYQKEKKKLTKSQYSMLACLFLSTVLMFFSISIVYSMDLQLPQGRLLFPTLSCIVILIIIGLDKFMSVLGFTKHQRKNIRLVLLLLVLTINFIFLFELNGTYSL